MKKAIEALRAFRDARDWGQFHDPKNLAVALSVEAAELNEVFLWMTTEASAEADLGRVKEELADVLAYALLLADTFKLDPEEIVLQKIRKNEEKYPVEKSRGKSTKYNQL
jgi:NTP pyrophosphatase (non-canonical NTP hydrolase)